MCTRVLYNLYLITVFQIVALAIFGTLNGQKVLQQGSVLGLAIASNIGGVMDLNVLFMFW
jgi:hypothetical protein